MAGEFQEACRAGSPGRWPSPCPRALQGEQLRPRVGWVSTWETRHCGPRQGPTCKGTGLGGERQPPQPPYERPGSPGPHVSLWGMLEAMGPREREGRGRQQGSVSWTCGWPRSWGDLQVTSRPSQGAWDFMGGGGGEKGEQEAGWHLSSPGTPLLCVACVWAPPKRWFRGKSPWPRSRVCKPPV